MFLTKRTWKYPLESLLEPRVPRRAPRPGPSYTFRPGAIKGGINGSRGGSGKEEVIRIRIKNTYLDAPEPEPSAQTALRRAQSEGDLQARKEEQESLVQADRPREGGKRRVRRRKGAACTLVYHHDDLEAGLMQLVLQAVLQLYDGRVRPGDLLLRRVMSKIAGEDGSWKDRKLLKAVAQKAGFLVVSKQPTTHEANKTGEEQFDILLPPVLRGFKDANGKELVICREERFVDPNGEDLDMTVGHMFLIHRAVALLGEWAANDFVVAEFLAEHFHGTCGEWMQMVKRMVKSKKLGFAHNQCKENKSCTKSYLVLYRLSSSGQRAQIARAKGDDSDADWGALRARVSWLLAKSGPIRCSEFKAKWQALFRERFDQNRYGYPQFATLFSSEHLRGVCKLEMDQKRNSTHVIYPAHSVEVGCPSPPSPSPSTASASASASWSTPRSSSLGSSSSSTAAGSSPSGGSSPSSGGTASFPLSSLGADEQASAAGDEHFQD